MAEFSLRDFLDLEAIVDDGEEDSEEINEEEVDDFFVDDSDIEELEMGPRKGSAFHYNDRRSTTEALESEARARDFTEISAQTHWYVGEETPRHLRTPTPHDLDLWAVRVKAGFECSLVFQIYRRCILGSDSRRLDIASALARDGIPGYIFLEGTLPAVRQAVSGLVTVFDHTPRLIPSEQRIALLASRNPLSRRIEEGQWVRCSHGLYRGDVGFVCGCDISSDSEIVVAFVPRIPKRSDRSSDGSAGKRKRNCRPLPRPWSSADVITEWGAAKVQYVSPENFIFHHENYDSGLVMKHLPPDSLVIVDSAPSNFESFLAAPSIREMPSFAPWVHRFAQDSLQPQQRVRVKSGEQRGLIGRVIEIIDSVAAIQPVAPHEEHPVPHISLRSLAPHYLPGDNVKWRWLDSCGIVASVDEVQRTLVFIEKDSFKHIATSMDYVEFYVPPRQLYHMHTGTWVEFHRQKDLQHGKRRGYVRQMQDTRRAIVIDEHSWDEFEIDVRELDVCSVQGPSLPKNSPVHRLVGQWVRVTRHPFKGYNALVKDVSFSGITVELEALLPTSSSPRQPIEWTDFVVMPKMTEPSIFLAPSRPRTPPAATDPSRTLTPEPEGSLQEHWLFSIALWGLLQRKRIPFYIRSIRGSGDGSLDAYEGKTARTVPLAQHKSPPRDGEVTVSVVRGVHPVQISIHPKFLVPWEPRQRSDVVVIDGSWLGNVGVVVRIDGNVYVVRFTVKDDVGEDSRDKHFEGNQLANLEPLRK